VNEITAETTGPPKGSGSLLLRRQINLIYVGLLVAMMLSSLDQMVFGTALPTIVGELAGVGQMLWVTTAYLLASTIMMPVYGKLGDLIGRRILLISAISIFIAGSVVGGLAPDMLWLIVGRAIQGVGGGGLMILAQATVADIVPPKDRGKYVGPMGAVFGLSAVAGPLLGGWFAEGIGWRWAFWINIPVGLIALATVAVFLRLPHRDYARPRLDTAGFVLMSIAVTCFVLFTSWGGNDYEWGSPVIIVLIGGAVLASVAFVLVERRAPEPLIPLFLFKERNFNLATGAGLITLVVMFGAMGYLPTYLQIVHGVNVTTSGLLLLPMVIGMAGAGVGSGQVASRTAHYKWMPLLGTLLIAVAMWLFSTLTVDTPIWVISVASGILGIGIGLGFQILVLIVQNTFPLSAVGTATAANNFFRQIGGTLGTAIVGSIFVARLTGQLTDRLPQAPRSTAGGVNMDELSPNAVRNMPAQLREVITTSYNDAVAPSFLYLLPLLAIAFVLLLFITEKPLETTLDYDTHRATRHANETTPFEVSSTRTAANTTTPGSTGHITIKGTP